MSIVKDIFQTEQDVSGLLSRLTLGAVILPHGLQQVFGWFGGYGFAGTMQFYTETVGLPWLVGFLVIMLQSVGSLMILLGLGSRFFALATIFLFIGMIVTSHLDYGFFMNWSGTQQGEGYEYHLLVIGLAMILLLKGAGMYSLDQRLSNRYFDKIPKQVTGELWKHQMRERKRTSRELV